MPVYSVVVALHREARVVPQLVAALAALDYPRGKLDIKLVIEHDDRATRCAIKALDLPATYETIVAPAGWPRTKPRALNIALPLGRGDLLVIFDVPRTPLLRANCARRRNVFCVPHANLPACRRGSRSTISRIPG